jgi:membrane-bound acyltransferase YfiQ involved in biofilm formation
LFQFAIKRAFIMYLFYFYLGMCCARNWDSVRPRLLAWSRRWWQPAALGLLIVLLLSYLFAVRFDMLILPPTLAFAAQSVAELCIYMGAIYLLFLLATLLTRSPSVWSAIGLELSRLSMGIYLVHVAVQRGVDWLLGALHLVPSTLVAYRYALLIVLPATALIVQALSYLPYAQHWLGVARARLTLRPVGGNAPGGECRG